MMAHTPGPWQAKDDDEVWAGEVHIADCMLYAYDDYFLIHDGMPGTNEDNATAIAALPDLLAACEGLMEWLADSWQFDECDCDVTGSPCMYCRVMETIEQGRAAIAKAEPKEIPDA